MASSDPALRVAADMSTHSHEQTRSCLDVLDFISEVCLQSGDKQPDEVRWIALPLARMLRRGALFPRFGR